MAPRMSAHLIADVELDVIDSVHVEDAGGHLQTLTLQFPQATSARNVTLSVAGWRGENRQELRMFTLDGLSLVSGESLRIHLSDGGRELFLDNRGGAKTFDLRLQAGVDAALVGLRSNVALDGSSIVRVIPSNWSITPAPPSAQIRLDTMDHSWGQVISSRTI
jgi:hypothetical protein